VSAGYLYRTPWTVERTSLPPGHREVLGEPQL